LACPGRENLPIATARVLQWTNVELDGSSLHSFNPNSYELIVHPNHPKPAVFTTPLSSSGDSFKNVWAKSS
jgi:hypothetical protein